MMIREPSRCWVPNLQIAHWEWDPSESNGGAPLPFPINAFSINFNPDAPCAGCSSPLESPNANGHTHHRFISNEEELDFDTNTVREEDFDMHTHAFSGDHFRMFEFKVRMCPRARSHDWTHCPYAHPSEKARRRDPRKYHYSGKPCPDFRKGSCSRGESCEFAHGVFECWLHPSRYRTQLCKDGTSCRRPVCFFAHTPEQLRLLPHESGEPSLNGSPIIHAFDSSWNQNASLVSISSPTSVLNSSSISSLSDSPPKSPGSFSRARVSEIVSSMRNVQLDEEPSTRIGSGFGSPRGSTLRPGFFSLPSTPKSGWNQNWEEEPAMERVESGRDLRARIYAKLSKENSFGPSDTGFSAPDIGWVSELVK